MSPEVAAQFDRAADGPITVDITTIGRTSGAPRRIEIWIVNVEDRIVICGTPGRRDWMANLRADPRLTVHLKDDLAADVEMTATEVTDPATRRAIWEHPSTEWYRGQAALDELIAQAPTVECDPR